VVRDLRFEWDERKNVQNQRTHGVSFEEAESVFLDDQALLLDDPDHSSREDRFVLVGLSAAVECWWSAIATAPGAMSFA